MERETAFLFAGLIFQEEIEKKALKRLTDKFGEIILKSKTIPFNFTDYYEKEMGERLLRQWILFDNAIKQEEIADIKNSTIILEKEFAVDAKRTINIDPGYITLSRVILPTTKDCSHRIYLRNGIFAEVSLIYVKNSWQAQHWTYRDYQTKTAIDFFNKCREYILKW